MKAHTGMLPRMAAMIALFVTGLMAAPLTAAAQTPFESAVGQHLGIFLTLADRREANERATAEQARGEIWFLRETPTQAARDTAVCDGARWLLTGRLDKSTGAQALFKAQPELQELVLVFYVLDTTVTPDRNGKYVQDRRAQPTVRLTLRRETAARLNVASLRKTLTGARCPSLAETVLDSVWTP
ncbi:MAG: hypothetical protein ACI9U2_001041 [Bradymonadia bacterium]|jgi:hypothetical protein